jgi:hypothetical protein
MLARRCRESAAATAEDPESEGADAYEWADIMATHQVHMPNCHSQNLEGSDWKGATATSACSAQGQNPLDDIEWLGLKSAVDQARVQTGS